jgi:outer membrane protein
MKKFILGLFVLTFALNANAQVDEGDWSDNRWKMRFRVISVIPNPSANITTIGGDAEISTAFVPEIDFTYFLSEHWALELILATAKHDVNTTGSDLSGLGGPTSAEVDLGSIWLLPPTLTLQYHFGGETFQPYFGGGLNYTFFYNQDAADNGPNVDYDNSLGFALQLGFDYALTEKWFLNFDAKYLLLNTDVVVDPAGLNIPAEVDINPFIIGLGVGFNF